MGRKKLVSQSACNSYEPPLYSEPRTDAQRAAFDIYRQSEVSFFIGPAGTGKTHLAVYCALFDMLAKIKMRRVDKVIITRPIVEAGEKLGYLPGEITEKVHPYMLPVYDCVAKMVHRPEEFIAQHFEISPLAYMRGRTFENCVAILDEAQNCSNDQLKLFITRLGECSKAIITGDPDQSDIGRGSALREIVDTYEGDEGIGVYRFDESNIVRHPIIGRMLKKWPKNS